MKAAAINSTTKCPKNFLKILELHNPAELTKAKFIINTVQYVTGCKKIISNRSRKRRKLFARYHAMHFMRKYTLLTQEQIGAVMCPSKNFNHATVIHAITTAQDMIDTMEGADDFYKNYMILKHIFIGTSVLN